MNWLDFFASVFGSIVSIAWPVAVFLSVWIFRAEIRPLLPKMRLKHKDTEIDFRMEEASRTAQNMEEFPAPQPTPEERSRFERLAEISSAAAVMEIRRDVESALKFRVETEGLQDSRPPVFSQMMRLLRSRELIDYQTSALLDDIRAIGNSAAHDRYFHMDTSAVLELKRLSDRVIGSLYFEKPKPASETE